jgi:hypothetical protein
MINDLTFDKGILVPLRNGIRDLPAGDGDAEGAHVIDELPEGCLGTLGLLLVGGVDLHCDREYL